MLDWRRGLEQACAVAGRGLAEGEFDRIVDAQGALEQGDFRDYDGIVRRSLTDVLGLPESHAAAVAGTVGDWPLFVDAPALREMMKIVPCAAMTNSDRSHGEAVQARLGRLDDWLCAEEVRIYKPDPGFWQRMSRRRAIAPGPEWWHVSAYADYDLRVAGELGLTTVFVRRPHARPGPASHVVADLWSLLALLS